MTVLGLFTSPLKMISLDFGREATIIVRSTIRVDTGPFYPYISSVQKDVQIL